MYSLNNPFEEKYRGFTLGRDWARDEWEWCIGGFMQIPSGGAIGVSSDWIAVELENKLWDNTVADVKKKIDTLIDDLTKPHIVTPSKRDGFDAYFLYKGDNPCFHWTKESIIESLQPLIASIDPEIFVVEGISVEVHQEWNYYYSVTENKGFEARNHDITERNSHPDVFETSIYGRIREKRVKITCPYDRDGYIRIYVHDVGEEETADIAAKAFKLYAAKEAILHKLESEQPSKL